MQAPDFNRACFDLTRAADGIPLPDESARRLIKVLLRSAGRIAADSELPGATWAGTEEQVLLWIDEVLRGAGYSIAPAEGSQRAPLPPASAGW